MDAGKNRCRRAGASIVIILVVLAVAALITAFLITVAHKPPGRVEQKAATTEAPEASDPALPAEEGAGVLTIETEEEFDRVVLRSDKVVVVDFWAPWCKPCVMVSPLIEELASEYAGQAVFAKVNVDQNRTVAARYRIQYLPTIGYFKNGKPVTGVIGVRDKSTYSSMLTKLTG